jgi:hypothetical protein
MQIPDPLPKEYFFPENRHCPGNQIKPPIKNKTIVYEKIHQADVSDQFFPDITGTGTD